MEKVAVSPSLNSLNIVWPEINRHNITLGEVSWEMILYSEYESCFFDESGSLKPHLEQWLKDHSYTAQSVSYGLQCCVGSTPCFIGFFIEQKQIRVASPRMANEQALLGHLDKGLFACLGEKFEEFQKHIEALLSLNPADTPSVWENMTRATGLVDFSDREKFDPVHEQALKVSRELQYHIQKYEAGLVERVTDYGLRLVSQYRVLRIHVLKFLAMLPSLEHDTQGAEVKRHWVEALRRISEDSKMLSSSSSERLPTVYLTLFKASRYLVAWMPSRWFASVARWKVRWMAKRFIAGETIQSAIYSLRELHDSGRSATLDPLGELVVSKKEADHYMEEVIRLIDGWSLHVSEGETNAAGILKAHVSIKVSALCHDFRADAAEYTYTQVQPRLIKILEAAQRQQVFINIDAEHYSHRNLVFDIYRRVLLETASLSSFAHTGIVVQAYLRDAYEHFTDVLSLAQERQLCMPIRLVKGAYWDAETIEAKAHSYNAPQFLNKEETDLCFRQLIYQTLEASPHLQLCLGSHNVADHCFAEVLREQHFAEAKVIEHQCLHMTYEALSESMATRWVVRNYIPIGNLLVGMSYLVRRIMENASQVGILAQTRRQLSQSIQKSPFKTHQERRFAFGKNALQRDVAEVELSGEFMNVPPVRAHKRQQWKHFQRVLGEFKHERLGMHYSNAFETQGHQQSIYSPSDSEVLVGTIQWATSEDAEKALELSNKAYLESPWPEQTSMERASVLLKAATIMLTRRNELASLIIYEAGKTALEALADVDEAIDFINFYAREEIRLHQEEPHLVSRGVVVVISPWNFPLAIPCGMSLSALVAGNTVILKSAEQTPLIAQVFVNLMHEAGVPKECLIHVPGEGEAVGGTLVKDPRVAGILFTGSKEVGFWISQVASGRLNQNQRFHYTAPTRVITEMGGKNAVIITDSAEMDDAVAGCIESAFKHAGQKCSALSRIIVHESVKSVFVERFQAACADLTVGRADEPSTYINPLISEVEQARVRAEVKEVLVEVKKYGGSVLIDRSEEKTWGHSVGPAVVEVPYYTALSQLEYTQKELFGPVVHVIPYSTVEQAIQLFNSTPYGLTGGVFSQSQDQIEELIPSLEAGNLYVNRSCTGARVGVEPFGGLKHSGTGPKAGSTSYVRAMHVSPQSQKQSILGDKKKLAEGQALVPRPPFFPMPLEQRLEYMQRAVPNIPQCAHVFTHLEFEQKKNLHLFCDWLLAHSQSFLMKRHPNHTIPGQLSYNDYSLVKERVLLLSGDKHPTPQMAMWVFSALALGCQFTLIATTPEALRFWKHILRPLALEDCFQNKVQLIDGAKSYFYQVIRDSNIAAVILDGSLGQIDLIDQLIYQQDYKGRYLPLLLTPQDAPAVTQYEEYFKAFLWPRSLAVNIMRHGAPMSLRT